MKETDKVPEGAKKTRKRDIALAGLKVFCEKGYDSATVEDIVRKAGCSHGLFYHYFKSKQEVFYETMKMEHEKSDGELLNKIDAEKDYNKKLRILIEDMFYKLKNDENFAYFYYFFVSVCFTGKRKNTIPPPPKGEEKHEPPIVRLEKLFIEGQKAGYFSDKHSAKECARLFFSIMQGATLGYVIAPKEIQSQMILPNIDYIIEIFQKETT